MLYAGPREVQWHAAARVYGGASHYIVGRDPAGMKHPTKNALQPSLGDDLYHMWHGQTMLQLNPVLSKKLQLLPFKFASYDKVVERWLSSILRGRMTSYPSPVRRCAEWPGTGRRRLTDLWTRRDGRYS